MEVEYICALLLGGDQMGDALRNLYVHSSGVRGALRGLHVE